MCGIVGYVGKRNCTPVLMKGLKRLEYRGYDSAGLAVLCDGQMVVHRTAGKISVLEKKIKGERLRSNWGIAHTRWATHGEPTTGNAHPHVDCSGKIAVAHNGIIENHAVLRKMLEQEGHTFRTDTDTEVLPHLIEKMYNGNLERAVGNALQMVEGTYGIAVICSDEPGKIVGARNGSPLLVGVNSDEFIIASDAAAVLSRTKQVVYLDDKEMVVVTPDGFDTSTIDHQTVKKEVEEIEWDLAAIEKAGFPHFMLKEIFEQPQAVRDAMRGRVLPEDGTARLGGLNMSEKELRAVDRIIITACGTSWHAAMIGEYMLEDRARIPR